MSFEELKNLGAAINTLVQNNSMHADIAESSLQHIKEFIMKPATEIPEGITDLPPQTRQNMVVAMPMIQQQFPLGYGHGLIPTVAGNPLPHMYPQPLTVIPTVHHRQ